IFGKKHRTPELNAELQWITCDMLDNNGHPDSGQITEALWLGHPLNLIYDEDGNIRVWALCLFQTADESDRDENEDADEEMARQRTLVKDVSVEQFEKLIKEGGEFAEGHTIPNDTLRMFLEAQLPAGQVFLLDQEAGLSMKRVLLTKKMPRSAAGVVLPSTTKPEPTPKLFASDSRHTGTKLRVLIKPRMPDVFRNWGLENGK
ncbi:hypothetical protein MPER_08063, partial [Moniliophthora perniciosa FA553]